MKIALPFLLALLISTATIAQTTFSSSGAFTVGIQTLNTDALAAFSAAAPQQPGTLFNWGGNVQVFANDVAFAVNSYGFFGRTEEAAGDRYSLSGGTVLLELGYRLKPAPFQLIPFAGVGFGGLGYLRNSLQEVTLPGGNDNPTATDFTANWGNVVFDAGLRIDYKSGGDERFGLLGLEIGYLFSPTTADWTTTGGGNIIGGPDFNLNGLQVKASFGGGSVK